MMHNTEEEQYADKKVVEREVKRLIAKEDNIMWGFLGATFLLLGLLLMFVANMPNGGC